MSRPISVAHYCIIFFGAFSVINTFMKMLTVFDAWIVNRWSGRYIQHWPSTICSVPFWISDEMSSRVSVKCLMLSIVDADCRKLIIINASHIQKGCTFSLFALFHVYSTLLLLWFDWKFDASTILLFVMFNVWNLKCFCFV